MEIIANVFRLAKKMINVKSYAVEAFFLSIAAAADWRRAILIS
jgi:hypothetical protein